MTTDNPATSRSLRHPLIWAGLIALTVGLGLGSRKFGRSLPGFLADYAGDTLWALVVFWGIGLCWRTASTRKVAILAMVFATSIEFSQLYQAPWLDSIRRSTAGGLVLGRGFLASDLACYAVGVILGVIIETSFKKPGQTAETSRLDNRENSER